MARSVIIALVVGILLADPVLCRAGRAEGPCSDGCRTAHQSPPCDSGPGDPCEELAHGCVCQGATTEASGAQVLSSTFLPLAVPPPADFTMGSRARPRPNPDVPLPFHARASAVGRSLRIRRQSFLI